MLNPFFENELGRYETVDDEIVVLLENKKDLNAFLRQCFVNAKATFDRKIGPFNRYYVEVLGPVIEYGDCIWTEDPVASETLVFSMTLFHDEIQNKTHRSELLNKWVLEGSNPTQFNKLLAAKFDIVDNGNGTVTIQKKPTTSKKKKGKSEANSETHA